MKIFWFIGIIFCFLLISCNYNNQNNSTFNSNNSGSISNLWNTKNIQNSNTWILFSTWLTIDNSWSFFGDIISESQWYGSYKITWALKWDFKSISVVWKYNNKEDEPYKLKKYLPEKRVFEYFVQPKFKTIMKWNNTYIFIWEKTSWEIEKKEFIINETKEILLSGKYCILDICINPKKPYKLKWDIITQESKSTDEYNNDQDNKITMDINKQSVLYEENFTMSNLKTNIFKLNNYFVRYSETAWCWWITWKQEILDNFWKVINDIDKTLKIPNWFYIWNKSFSLENLNNNTSTYIYWTLNDSKEFLEIQSIFDKSLWSKLLSLVKKDKKDFPKKYIISYKEYPWMKFVYSMKDIQPERVIFLWTSTSYLKNNIGNNWELLDIDVVNKILSYYSVDRFLVKESVDIYANKNSMITKITKNDLPIFKVEKLSSDGYYLLYPIKWLVFQSFAEMCKPVIYVYNKDNINLNVSLNLFGKWFFTKLIPQFNDVNNTWKFSTNSSWVTLDNINYPYLYYSVKIKDYSFNKNWWIVKWSEIKDFFEDKLKKIWFNEKEKFDFIDFWKYQFLENKYYFISFKYNSEMDSMVWLNFDKQPNSIERILLESYDIENIKWREQFLYKNVWDKYDSLFLKKFIRDKKFDVFEWWWVLVDWDKIIIK